LLGRAELLFKAVPTTVEYTEVEARIARMTEAELVDMDEHPDDYEPWALELGRVELAKRNLAPERVGELRRENAEEAAQETRARERRTAWLWIKFAALAIPLLIGGLKVVSNALNSREEERLSVACAQMLAKATGEASSDETVKLEGHSLATRATIESVTPSQNGARVLAGIQVAVDVDGQRVPALTSGSIGIDSTREGALRIGIEEWVAGVGVPMVNALTGKGETLRVGAFVAHPGPIGIRGPMPELLDGLRETILRDLAPDLSRLLSGSGLHALSFMVVWHPDGTVHGEFRIDGEISDPLKQLAQKVKWPKGQDTYILKQYYVLAAATDAGPPR